MRFDRPKKSHTVLACVALAAVTLAIYWPVTRCEFIHLDDPAYVTANSAVTQGLHWRSVVWAFRANEQANWHPLTWLSHMLDVQLFGLRPAAHHLVNVGFHTANALLLFLVLLRLTGALWRCLFVAALFALHPLHVESVAWISERKDVLSTCFGLLALGAWVRYAEPSKVQSPKSKVAAGAATPHAPRSTLHPPLFYALALLLFACSLMSKPTLVTFPFLLLLLDYWPLRRMQNAGASALPARSPFFILHSSFFLLEKLPFLALSAASCVVTIVAQTRGGAVRSFEYLPLSARLGNAAVGYVAYLRKAFWPAPLAVVYPLPAQRPDWQVAGAALLLAVLTLGALLAWRRRYWLVGWLWFLGLLVPMIGLIQVGDQAIADRYTYLPLVGVFLALTWGVAELWPRRAGRQWALAAGMLAVLGACAVLTSRQLALWQNTELLTRHAIAVTKDNYVAYDNLGAYYWEHGRTPEAIACYRQSLAVHIRLESLNNLGIALASQGKYAEAIANYEIALREYPDEVGLRLNLADAFDATGRNADVIAQYQAVLRLQPDLPGARDHLARALTEAGRLDEAIAQYQLVLRAHPNDLQTHNNLGIALTTQGQLDQAVAQFQQVLRRDPNYANAYVNLGNALAQQNKFPEALAQFRRYVQLQPNDPRGHQGLGRGLLELGQFNDALPELNTVLRLQPDNPQAHYYYALALARLDRRPEAIAQFREALRLQPDYPDAARQLGILSAPTSH